VLIERLRGFGMILTGVDNHPEHPPNGVRGYAHDELKVAAAETDYLVLAIPGTKENENMIDGTPRERRTKGAARSRLSADARSICGWMSRHPERGRHCWSTP
jgi:phosphoglycerate dehydrogenase-like enzyme